MTATMMTTTKLPSIAMAMARRFRGYLATVGAHVGENAERQWIHDPVGDQRNGEAASRRGGDGNHGQVVAMSNMMMLFCGVCLCVLCALWFVAVCFWFEFKFKFVTFDIVLVPVREFYVRSNK